MNRNANLERQAGTMTKRNGYVAKYGNDVLPGCHGRPFFGSIQDALDTYRAVSKRGGTFVRYTVHEADDCDAVQVRYSGLRYGPELDEDSMIFLYEIIEVDDMALMGEYPDRVLIVGPRGGIRVESC